MVSIPTSVTSSARRVIRSRPQLVDRVLDVAPFLDPGDRALLQAVLSRGIPAITVARAAGVPTRQLQRRVQRLLGRLTDPIVPFVLARRDDWSADRRAVADVVVLRGRSLRAAADTLDQSLHHVRRHVHDIRLLCEVERRGREQFPVCSEQ